MARGRIAPEFPPEPSRAGTRRSPGGLVRDAACPERGSALPTSRQNRAATPNWRKWARESSASWYERPESGWSTP